MIVQSFKVNGFTLTDIQDMPSSLSDSVTTALNHGLHIFPVEYQCDAVERDPDGEFPIIRLGVFDNKDQLIGGVWFGCNIFAPDSTERNVKILTRPLAGPILEHEATFWKGSVWVQIINHLLRNQLQTDEGSTIQFVSFDYVVDSRVMPEGLAAIHGEFGDRLANDTGLERSQKELTKGGFEVSIKKKEIGPAPNGRL